MQNKVSWQFGANPFRRLACFVVLFFLLQAGWQGLEGTALQSVIVHNGTVVPAAFLINHITPPLHAQALGSQLVGGSTALQIVTGCEGMEALILLWTAFAVAPISWSSRLKGVAGGMVVVFIANQARIVALFYAYRRDHSLFSQVHEVIAPIAIVLVVSGYFYAWLLQADRRAAASP